MGQSYLKTSDLTMSSYDTILPLKAKKSCREKKVLILHKRKLAQDQKHLNPNMNKNIATFLHSGKKSKKC